jgi:hypothetical protein
MRNLARPTKTAVTQTQSIDLPEDDGEDVMEYIDTSDFGKAESVT